MNDACWVIAKLHLARFVLANCSGDVGRDGACTWAGHQSAWPEHFAQRPDEPHHVGGCDAYIEIGPALLDLLGQVVGSHVFGAGRVGILGQIASGKHNHAFRLANAMRQNNRAADDLIRLLRVNSKPKVNLNGLIKFRRRKAFQHGHGLGQRKGGFGLGFFCEHRPHAFGKSHSVCPRDSKVLKKGKTVFGESERVTLDGSRKKKSVRQSEISPRQ